MGTVEGPRDTKPALKEKRGVCFRESGHMFVSAGQDTPRSVWLPPVMCSQPPAVYSCLKEAYLRHILSIKHITAILHSEILDSTSAQLGGILFYCYCM